MWRSCLDALSQKGLGTNMPCPRYWYAFGGVLAKAWMGFLCGNAFTIPWLDMADLLVEIL